MQNDTKARLLYCMDMIMRHLNDEDAQMGWFAYGVPDGTIEEGLTESQLQAYADLGVDDSEFTDMFKVFLNILATQVYGGGVFAKRKPHAEGVFF